MRADVMARSEPIFRYAPRLAALAFGVILIGAVEVLCRVGGLGDYRDRPDPFAGPTGLQPLFRRTAGSDGVEILRTVAPGDPRLSQLEQWVAGNLPFKLSDQAERN
jgi:hypothetical protein